MGTKGRPGCRDLIHGPSLPPPPHYLSHCCYCYSVITPIPQARIVAMTCTHAALTRRKLAKLGFKFDNLVMEEAAQILEIETFIPMLLQDYDAVTEGCR